MFYRLLKYVIPTFIGTYILWYLMKPEWLNQFCIICFLLIISWTIGYYFYDLFEQKTIDSMMNKIILITGCDTGFGNRLAYRLDRMGFHVYAGVLFPLGDDVQQLQQKCSNRLKIMRMDVTKPEEVNNVVEQIKQSGMPLWALVNNAGIGISVPFDWGNDIDVYRKVFDVNIFGVVRVTKSCMPLLRRSRGRIINVASAAGRMPAQWMGHYCMTKHNVRIFSDILRRELIGTGIKVITIEPSFFRTQIVNFDLIDKQRAKIFNETPDDIRQSYGGEKYLKCMNASNQLIMNITHDGIDQVIQAMINGIIRKYPKIYYRCCTNMELFTIWAASHLPEILLDSFTHIYNDRLYRQFKIGKYSD
ncbi:d-beta-hydroxybutyrate dehydrogenase [Dermatophagoides farinae]|uniref:D-beta-hydroxybutyrate dehydrogenase n=1 Tax=Dermatophagoides farinae TaxID=6954 RepID=A0A9D4SK61_DERFA|nr:retinol dehydrogenase 7-like [Dermatophagoides farinae]KAH7644110.1 d-beta-hydroxybutyrate dehydrogenase [Dermatophagoides farinae]